VRETVAATPADTSTWKVYTFVGDQQLNAGTDPLVIDPITLTFDGAGALTAPAAPITFQGFTPLNAPKEQVISIDFGTETTQLPQSFSFEEPVQDGSAVGQLEGITIGGDGMVRASFSNGATQALGKVVLANFSNPQGLRQLGYSTWASTGVSGEARLGEPGSNGFGALMSGQIERSNVDITEELVGLIAAQRNFQANAKALDTASQISQAIFNMRN
jgi:flagellar hook protein FlgE